MTRVSALAIALALIWLPNLGSAAPTIERIEVMLFLSHTGTFSAPIPDGTALWNTISGESGLREPSSSTLVKVRVSAAPRSEDMKAVVQLAVREKGSRTKKLFVKGLGAFSPDGKRYVAFWLPDTGCDELLLEASIRGSKDIVKHTVPFRCGE